MAITSAMVGQVTELYTSLFGRAPESDGLGYWVARLGNGDSVTKIANEMYAVTAARVIYPSYLTNEQIIGKFYTNVLGRTADATGLAFWTAKLNATGASVGDVVVQMIAAVNTYSGTDVDGLASKALFTNKVAAGTYYATTGGNSTTNTVLSLVSATSTAATVNASIDAIATSAGQTITLTTGADVKVGGSGSDSFDGSLSTAGTQTLSSLDSLDGGAGADALTVVLNSGAVTTPQAIKGIESISATSTVAGSGLSLLTSSGVTSITVAGSTQTTTISNIQSTSTTLTAQGNSATPTFTFVASAVSGTSDSATVTLSANTGGVTIDDGIETLNIIATGGTDSGTVGSSAGTLKISGDATSLSVGTQGTSTTKIDASGFAGTFTVTGSATSATVTGGSGNDSVTLSATTGTGSHVVSTGAGNDSITIGVVGSNTGPVALVASVGSVSLDGGAGNDTFTFSGGFNSSDTIVGGDGTDTLNLRTTSEAVGITSTLLNVSGIETVSITDALTADATDVNGIVDLTKFGTGVTRLVISDSDGVAAGTTGAAIIAAGFGVTFNPGTSSLALTGAIAATGADIALTVGGVATTDAVTLTLSNTLAGVSVLSQPAANARAITGAGVETLTLSGTRTVAGSVITNNTFTSLTLTPSANSTATVNFTGAGADFTGAINSNVIDASGMSTVQSSETGLSMGAASTSFISQTITGSAGRDVLIGGAGNDNINGGTGNDTITSGAGNDTILGGEGNDTLILAGNLASGDSIDGGAGTDTLSISSASVTAVNSLSLGAVLTLNDRISNIENLLFSNDPGASVDLARLDGISNVEIAAATAGPYTFSGFGAGGTLTLTTATNNLTATMSDETGVADVFNLVLKNAATTDFGTANIGSTGIETVNVTTTEGTTANATVRVHTIALGATSGLKTLNLSGTETVTTTVSSTDLTTVDASALSAGIASVTATASLANITFTGSNQDDVFTSGSGNDLLNGGNGADNLNGGAGNDTVNGGTGDDTIVAGAGSDVLSGGDGTDTLTTAGWTINTTTDGGTTAVQGVVVNLGSGAVASSTISGYVGFGAATATLLNTDISAVAAGTLARMGTAATVSTRLSTVSGFENVTGTDGKDYIVGTSLANSITGGLGADVLVGGAGADTFIFAAGSGVTASATTLISAGSATILEAGETITFANGVDIITDFVAGTDVIKGFNAGAAVTALSVAAGASTGYATGTNYFVSGSYNIATGVFTTAANGTGVDTLVFEGHGNAITTNPDFIVLMGVNSGNLVAGSFVA